MNNKGEGKKEMEQTITIGDRILDNEQLQMILPGHAGIDNQIKKMREYAAEYNKERKAKTSIGNKKNITTNNVCTILGGRGAGKSCVLASLKNRFEYKDKNKLDVVLPIVLPIIFPETMGKRSDMTGWLLGMFNDIVNEIANIEIKLNKQSGNSTVSSAGFVGCRKVENETMVRTRYIKVLEQYRYTREDYADILKEQYSGLKEYVNKTQKILDPENRLREEFFQFIDTLMDVKRENHKNDNKEEKEPMVFIFLDDADLSKDRCQEVLDLIIRYLSHPNVVVMISGDYQIFEDELFISYMRKGGLMDLIINPTEDEKNRIGKRLMEENRRLAQDNLKKIFPPALRYQLRTLGYKERLNFYFEKKGEEKKTLEALLKEKFKQQYDKHESLNVIDAYGMFLDGNPRGVMNVYYALQGLDNNSVLSGDTRKIEDYVENLKNVTDTMIRSSSILSKYEDEIHECIQITYKFEESFVNYPKLVRMLKKHLSEVNGYNFDKNNKQAVEEKVLEQEKNADIMVVFIFAHFIESLVQLVNPKRKIHGKDELFALLVEDSKLQIYPRVDQLHIILDLYEAMLSNDAQNIMPTMENIYRKDFAVKFYFENLGKIKGIEQDKISADIMKYIGIISQDSKWTEEKFTLIYYHRNPLAMEFSKAIDNTRDMIKQLDERLSIQEEDTTKNVGSFERHIKDTFTKLFYNKLIEGINAIDNGTIIDDLNRIGEAKKESIIIKNLINIINELLMQVRLGKEDAESCKEQVEANAFEIEKDSQEIQHYVSEYLSGLNMNILPNWIERKESKTILDTRELQIIQLHILLSVLKALQGKLDIVYYNYFEQWHRCLSKASVYNNWCAKKAEESPLTLILESKEHVQA